MTYYTTTTGDMLDAIAWRHYGSSSGYVESILENNPGLARLPPHLPGRVVIALPDPPPPSRPALVSLWD